jgi:hypothetical protein
VETNRQFPLYFPELVAFIDKTYRTQADREHRAASGYSVGGFMAYWIAGKYPDLVSSASSFMGSPEFFAGPQGFDVEYNLEDCYANYDGVRTRLVTGTRDFIQFYHRRLNALWTYAAAHHETEEFDSDHAAPGIAKTFDFHMRSFADPLPRPAVFSHTDVYPNFSVWGWEVASNRRQPGFTTLEDISSSGFHSAVREWLPAGATLPGVKMSIESAPLYPPGRPQTVTYIRLRDGNVRGVQQKADAQGRLTFEMDGDAYAVGVAAGPLLDAAGYEIADAAWATAGQPVKLRVRFWNKGAMRSPTSAVQWKSPNPGVRFDPPTSRLFGLGPGESGVVPVTVTVTDPARPIVRIVAAEGANSLPFSVPLFPPAERATNFEIADGRMVTVFQGATEASEVTMGAGNGDGHAAPGERFAILLPDAAGAPLRAAEVFTNDACLDNSTRISDSWSDHDHVGASVKYSLLAIRPECEPGHVVHLLARIVIPNAPRHQVKYWSLEFPVWYRTAP